MLIKKKISIVILNNVINLNYDYYLNEITKFLSEVR